MTRKIFFDFEGREYRVDGDDIETIIEKSGLNKIIDSKEKRLAFLGLRYLNQVSWAGGGYGDLEPFDDFNFNEEQKKLLMPAFETIKKYYK